MTLSQLNAKVGEWDLRNVSSFPAFSHYSSIFNQLDYHAKNEWRVYLPTEHTDFNSNYMERLAAWIGNSNNEADQKLLLEYALHISFFSHYDFVALYRTALDKEIVRWVATQVGASLEPGGGNEFNRVIHEHIHHRIWFCPVTDSMDINEFYKVNHLKGIGHRPGFATLQMLAENAGSPNTELANNVLYYMENPSQYSHDRTLDRLVLLEDIVGSGSQCIDAVKWAVANINKPILLVPLILCPNGAEVLRTEENRSNGHFTVRPVIELKRSDLLGPERQGMPGWEISEELEELVARFAPRASAGIDPFGYGSTGCSLVTFSNTPDNTLPIIHNKSGNGDWTPLFPRIYRD